ncbi:MAG: response regulator [Rhodospirillaceae bacterium]|nr:MAG: response regulator [Rhodospirillaceae bacterium]
MRQVEGGYHILLVEDDLADAGLVRIALRRGRHTVNLHHAKDSTEAFAFLRRIGSDHARAHPIRVLLLEDDPADARLVDLMLRKAPRPHLILLDLNLPGRSGHEILQELKSDNALRGIPVIVLSTSEAERDIVRSYNLGANSFISKPMDADEFAQHIHIMETYWFDIVRLPAA